MVLLRAYRQMTQTHIPSFIHFFLMKTQEWKDCYVHRNIGIRGSNAKYETGMKELKPLLQVIIKCVYSHCGCWHNPWNQHRCLMYGCVNYYTMLYRWLVLLMWCADVPVVSVMRWGMVCILHNTLQVTVTGCGVQMFRWCRWHGETLCAPVRPPSRSPNLPRNTARQAGQTPHTANCLWSTTSTKTLRPKNCSAKMSC